MTVIGLTGSSGSGKSSVSALLKEQGFTIIDCDGIARAVLRPDTPCLAKIFETFGETVKNTDSTLNRRALAKIVFTDAQSLEKLNAIMYPQITTDIIALLKQYRQEGQQFVVLDAPTLFESGADRLCDCTVSVLSEDTVRIKRIMARDGLSEEMARARLSSQQENNFYRTRSDYIVENHGTPEELNRQTKALAERIKTKYP